MDCKVIISPRAIQDLRGIVRYISFDNPSKAQQFGYHLIDAALSLQNFPERGRFVPEFDDAKTREIFYNPYRIIYRFDPEQRVVSISRFWHASRGLPEL